MATYNGAEWIREQLESLQQQTLNDFILYVHDDQSSDNTIAIIQEFSKQATFEIKIINDDQRRGHRDSFMMLLNSADANYYMFCDQDDYWLENKVEDTYNKIREMESSHSLETPLMTFTDLKIVDSDLNTIHDSMLALGGYDIKLNSRLEYLVHSAMCTSCTMMINNALKQKCNSIHPKAKVHDWWISLIAAKYGKIELLPQATILYRQHGNNSIGAMDHPLKSYSISRLFNCMSTYNDQKEVFESLGIGYLKALKSKISFILKHYGIIPGFKPFRVEKT